MADREFNGVKIKVDFNETANRQQISSGDNLNTLFGKIRKWLSDLKAVAFSGSYNDLENKPEIPTVGNGKIIINQAGVKKGEFTVNQSGNATVDLDGGSNISLTNNLLATVPGVSALDAAVGSVIENRFGGCSLEQDGKDFYIVGADSVRKKLGSVTVYIRATSAANPNSNLDRHLTLQISFDNSNWQTVGSIFLKSTTTKTVNYTLET